MKKLITFNNVGSILFLNMYIYYYLQIAVVGFFADCESEEAEAFIDVANMVSIIVFGVITNAELNAKYEAKKNQAILFKPYDTRRLTTRVLLTKMISIHSSKSTRCLYLLTSTTNQHLKSLENPSNHTFCSSSPKKGVIF